MALCVMSPTAAALVALAGLFVPTASAQIVAESVGEDVVQFHASERAREQRVPSMCLQSPIRLTAPAPAGWKAAPVFSTDDQGRFVAVVDIEPGTSLYGTGQAAGPLKRNGRVTETWNHDAYGYQDEQNFLYTSHPWVLAVRADGSAFGVLADTTYRSEIDLRDGIAFRTQGPAHPVLVIEGARPMDVVTKLAELTGTIEMPPRWALGYHQCRWSYYPDSRVREVATEFRRREIPADVIWLDIHYMDEYRVFTFDDERFPDPAGLNAFLDSIGFSNVWMIDPGVKNEDGYVVHDSGNDNDVWVKSADGAEFRGDVWPGQCVFPDFTNKDVRAWWAGLYKDYMATGIDGVWNDMNEPAVFGVDSKTMPLDNRHNADPELGGPADHARFHNVYGMLMVQASREGVMAANPGKRPFVLSRANHLGGQRFGATWTGDNSANWYHVDVSIPMTLNLGLSGQPFVGPDLGGFANDGTAEMFSRWMGFGALMPFARAHTASGNRNKEPWAFGAEVEATCRRAIERRYRLMPLIYTLFEQSHREGAPVARPLFFADPIDPALRSEDDAFMLGDNLIVAADPTPARERAHVLPSNDAWLPFDFESFDGGRDSKDPDQARLFIRAGGIVPTGPVHQHFGDRPDQRDELTLLIALDESGFASGELYEDAGEGWAFRDGEFLRTRYTAQFDAAGLEGNVIIKTETLGGGMPRPDRTLSIRLIGPNGTEYTAAARDGDDIELSIKD